MDIFSRETKAFASLSVCEIQFWLGIMRDHAIFLLCGLPSDQPDLRQEAQKFEAVFCDLEKRSFAVCGGEAFSCFVKMVELTVKNFFAFKRHLLQLLIECKLCGAALYPLSVDHMSREAMYFLILLRKFFENEVKYPVEVITHENVFWLRMTADHLKFIQGLLDPSSRQLYKQVQALVGDIDQLGLQARDLDSMLWHFRPANVLIRFEKDVAASVFQLNSFYTAVETVVKEGGQVSLIPLLLIEHIRRETEYFLKNLERIRTELMKADEAPLCCCDYD